MLSDHRTNVEIHGKPLLFKLGLTGPCGVKIILRTCLVLLYRVAIETQTA